MHVRHLVPFVILMAWQAAPSGRFRVAFGSGASNYLHDIQWYDSDLNCDYSGCNCFESPPYTHHGTEDQSYKSTGVQLEAWPSNSIRVTGSAGKANDALVGALEVAWEGRWLGLGGGYAHSSDSIGESGLAGYLRLGKLDGAHLRGELLPPSPIWGVGGWSRVGLGYNLGRGPGTGVFVGVAKTTGNVGLTEGRQEQAELFADVNVPVLGRTVDLLLRGHLGVGSSSPPLQWGLGAGERVLFEGPWTSGGTPVALALSLTGTTSSIPPLQSHRSVTKKSEMTTTDVRKRACALDGFHDAPRAKRDRACQQRGAFERELPPGYRAHVREEHGYGLVRHIPNQVIGRYKPAQGVPSDARVLQSELQPVLQCDL